MARSTEAVNCRLVLVRGEGIGDVYADAVDPYGQGADPDPDPEDAPGGAKWTGDVGVWLEERTEKKLEGGAANVHTWRTLLASRDLGIAWAAGDVATIAPDGRPEETVTVQEIAEDRLPKGDGGEVLLTLRTD